MTKQEWSQIVKRLRLVFPDAISKSVETEAAWYDAVSDVPFPEADKAAKLLVRETELLRVGTNLGAVIRNRACPLVTASTVENHLYMACSLARSKDGNQYEYLKKIDPRLLELAERADVWGRDLSSEAQGFRVREVARQFIEERENKKRGYLPPEPIPVSRQLEGPAETPLPPEEGLKKVQEILGKVAKGRILNANT